MTSPNTTCFPFKNDVSAKVMKNWEPFVSDPEFAIDNKLALECPSLKFSSLNFPPKMDSLPVPSPLMKSPPYAINPGMIRWNFEPWYVNCLPDILLSPFTPEHISKKF